MSTRIQAIVIGSLGVGKRSILSQYCWNSYPWAFDPTGERFVYHFGSSSPTPLAHQILEFWEHHTPGQSPEDKSIITALIVTTDIAVVLIYDVTSPASFQEVANLCRFIKSVSTSRGREVLIVGNKADLETDPLQWRVKDQDVVDLVTMMGKNCQFARVSAKDNQGLDEMFFALAVRALEKQRQREIEIEEAKVREEEKEQTRVWKVRSKIAVKFSSLRLKVMVRVDHLWNKALSQIYGRDRRLDFEPIADLATYQAYIRDGK